MARAWRRDARRPAIVALLLAAVIPARADEPPRRADTEAIFGRKPRAKKPVPRCADATALACPRRDGAAPAATEVVLTRARLARLPVADGDVAAVGALGVSLGRDDFGVTAGGATGVDTAWTVDGAPIDAPFTGGLGLVVPLAFVERVTVGTGGFGAASAAGVGAAIDVLLRRGGDTHTATGHAWLTAGRAAAWLPRGRDRYQPFRGRVVGAREVSLDAVASGPLPRVLGGRTWYLAGVAPSLADGSLERQAFRQGDDDGDGAVDRDGDGAIVHERVSAITRDAATYDVPVVARVGFARPHHAIELTALGELARTTRWLTAAEAAAAGVDRGTAAGSAAATWRGTWSHLELRVQGAWYRAARRDRPHTAAGDVPAIGRAYVPAVDEAPVGDADDQQVRAACVDAPGALIRRCPIATGFHWSGGAGTLTELVIDRPSVTADVTYRRGEHRLAAGIAGDDVRAVSTTRYSGGSLRQALGPDTFIDYQLIVVGSGPDTCAGTACRILERASTTYRTRTVAAYVADTWRPAPAVAVEYGVRAQRSQLGEVLTVQDVLPRVGAAWDPIGDGRSRVFVGWGRHAAPLPVGLGAQVYAGPQLVQRFTFAGTTDESLGGFAGRTVAAGTRGTRVDETVAGAEIGQPDVVRAGVSWRTRHLGRALDTDGGELASAGARTGAVATREYDEVAAWLDGSPASRLAVRVGYTWSRLRGNWPGPAEPVEGVRLGASSLFDDGKDAAYATADGVLPNDQPHRFFAEVAMRGGWRGFAVDGGVRATLTSGRARSARIGFDQTYAVPRGALGRLAPIAQANVHLSARRGRWTATLDVLNLFDRRTITAVEEVFARDATPIVDGDASDLVWLKDDVVEGAPALRVPGFGQATRTQAPITAILGISAEL